MRARTVVLFTALSIPGGTAAAQPDKGRKPQSPSARIEVKGEALRSALQRIGSINATELTASRSLQQQRVTLYGSDVPLRTWMDGLRSLLSASPEASVVWKRLKNAKGWRLEETLGRQRLAERLRNVDQEVFARFLNERIAWAKEKGLREAAMRPAPRRGPGIDQAVSAAVVAALGEDGIHRLLSGEPMVMPIETLRRWPLGPMLNEWVVLWGPLQASSEQDVNQSFLVLMRERNTRDPAAGGITGSFVRPTGFMSAVAPLTGLRLPQRRRLTEKQFLEKLAVPIEGETPEMRRASFRLTPANAGSDEVEMNLNDLLAVVARELKLTVVADGYLRRSLRIPAGYQVKNCPVDRLLTRLADAWDCEWRYLDPEKSVVAVRARYWWLEDEADVPEQQLKDLLPRFDQARPARLEDLLRLAELSDAQIRKLTEETKLSPAASGLLPRGLHTGIGAKPCLQFFSRLPQPLKARALSAEGLPLAEVDPRLVQVWLYRTLVGFAGAVTPELRARQVFFLEPVLSPDTGQLQGYRVRIRSSDRRGCNWSFAVALPPKITHVIEVEN